MDDPADNRTDEQVIGRSVPVDGQRFKKMRLRLGMTQEEIASAVGYSVRLVRKLESGGPVSQRTLADFVIFDHELRAAKQNDTVSNLLEKSAMDWFERAFHQRDLDVIDDLCDPTVILIADGSRKVGRPAVRNRIQSILDGFNPLLIRTEQVYVVDGVVIVYWRFSQTHSGKFLGIEPTGQTVETRGNTLVKFKDGKIFSLREHWDAHQLIDQLTASDG